jgi:hypothetical protein
VHLLLADDTRLVVRAGRDAAGGRSTVRLGADLGRGLLFDAEGLRIRGSELRP